MRILPFRLPERSALLAVCLSAASTQCVGKLHYEEARSALAVGTRENMKENSGSNRRNFLTTNEAAQRLGVSYYTVYEYIREKRLVAEMVSGVYIIPEKAVEEFKAKPTGRTRVNPPPWRVYRAGAKVRGLDIHVQALPGQKTTPQRSSFRSSGKTPSCQMNRCCTVTSMRSKLHSRVCLTGIPHSIR